MYKRKFTTVIQLHEKNNQNIIDYIESSRGTYTQALRKTFHVIKNSSDFNKSRYNTYLQETYGILKRTANSIIADAQGQLNALKELKIYEQKQLTRKTKSLKSKIEKLEEKKADNCTMLRAGLEVNLIKQDETKIGKHNLSN